MPAFSALSRIAKPGQTVCLKTRVGSGNFEEREGILLELLPEGMVMDTGGEVEYIQAGDIVTWRLLKPTGIVDNKVPPIVTLPSRPKEPLQLEFTNQLEALQSNKLTKATTSEVPTLSSEELEIFFVGEPTLSNPVLSFEFPKLEKGLQKEIDRWQNRYEYALKVREPARMSQDVAAVAELAESLNNLDLYVLAGNFAYISGLGASPYYEAAAKRGSRHASIALASLAIEKKDWRKAAESLISALRVPSDSENNTTLIRVLGQCMLQIPDKVIPGLGNILESGLSGSAHRLAISLVALSVKDEPEAYMAALKSDIQALRCNKIGNNLFSWGKETPAALEINKNELPTLNKKSDSRKGHISAFYPEKKFGFIVEDTTRQTWFFRLISVTDDSLLSSLLKSEIKQFVVFTGNPGIVSGRYPFANGIQIISTDGSVPIVNQGRAPLLVRIAGVPKDGSCYARAKMAEQLDQLDQAETLYNAEITGDGIHCKSAIKDLAALLNRKVGPESAIELMEKYRYKYSAQELISLDQMKVQFYVKARRYGDASKLLAELAKNAYPTAKKIDLLRQEASCYFADGDFDTAIEKLNKLLKTSPKDKATLLLIGKIMQAKESGSTLDETARMTDSFFEDDGPLESLALGLSVLASRHLKRCELVGIDERRRETRNFSKIDFSQVKGLLQGITGRRPREQAGYLLTLAVLCNQMPELNVKGGMQRFLMWYFAAIAEAAMSENVNTDVVRCYAIESLLFHSNQHRDQVENAWALLLGTYCSDMPEPSILLSKEKDEQGKLLFERFRVRPDDWQRFMCDASYYKIKAPLAFNELERHIQKNKLSLTLYIDEENTRIKEEDAAFHAVSSGTFSVDSLRRSRETLAQRIKYVRFELDRQRMQDAVRIFGDITEYALERHFSEREARFLRLEAEIQRFLDDIEKSPTHLSIEKLYPPFSSHLEELHKDFDRACISHPAIEIRNVLDSDFYTVNDNQISLRLLLYSRDKSSPPIEAIDLIVDEGGAEPCHSPEPLSGGHSREIELAVRPSEEQIIDGAFTVNIAVQYRNRSGIMEKLEPQALAVRLGRDTFEEIPNPYNRYSGGSPVEDESMFFGRRSLVDRIARHLLTGDAGQCFVLYGQKRSGKSSVLKQVEKRLADKALIVSISAGTFDPERLWISFARLFIQEVEFRIEDVNGSIPDGWPSFTDAENRPIEAIRSVARMLRKLNHRLVIAIDEFTYIFEKSQSGIEDFMRGWKALLEAKTFNALLIGQDTMPRFKQAYPNEFGVTHDERISYLSREETNLLATQPILFNGESRYRGQALQRLYDLTAGSPYFLQIVCDRLVRHLNARHAPFVTEADIELVRKQLTDGVDCLPQDRFDALVTAAGEKVAIVPRQDLWAFLTRVARESLHSGQCYRNAISDLNRAEEATKDLIDREVLASDGDRISIRVGLFAFWLRSNQ
jgi:tetratricopeptide (TPR) repeat protein